MEFLQFFELLVTDYTLRTISLGTAILGIVCGMLGSFAVLRKQSLLGDAIAHAALPGIAIAFLLTGVKDPLLFFLGAAISGIIGALWIYGITSRTHLKSDTAMGIVLSVFFGFGILLLTIIQKLPNANQAGLDKFLFGQAATIMEKDVVFIAIVGAVSLLFLIVFWKEFKIITFDAQYAKTLGFNIKLLDILLTSLIVVAIVIGLQIVGVVLMSALLLAPAAAARQWTNKLGLMVFLASVFGAVAGLVGTATSAIYTKIATGPVIVLFAVTIVLLSFIFAPSRGLLLKQLNYYQNRKNLILDKTLSQMFEIASLHNNYSHLHSIKILNNFQGFRKNSLKELQSKGLIVIQNNEWNLTEKGFLKAKNLYNEIKSV